MNRFMRRYVISGASTIGNKTTYRYYTPREILRNLLWDLTPVQCADCSVWRLNAWANHWGLGIPRCHDCSELFRAEILVERTREAELVRAAWDKHRAASEASGVCPDDDVRCEDCCSHEELDCGHCCECGADRTEDLMAAAYDRAKDARKYGE